MLTVMAQTATDTMATAPADSPYRFIFQMVILFAIFYFILIRPQQKRARQQIQMLESLKVGQDVIVNGMFAKITKILNERDICVEIAPNVQITVLRSSVSQVLSEMDILTNKPNKKKEV